MAASYPPSGMLDTPFLRGKRYRADELGDAVVQAANWRRAALGAMAGMLVMGLGLVYVGTLPKLKPYYIEVDSMSGGMRVVGYGPDVYQPGPLVIRKHLRDFVHTLRAVSPDKVLMRQAWATAYYQLTPRGKQALLLYATERKPLERTDPVLVEILSVRHKTDLTYDVRWAETTYNAKGEKLDSTTYSGLFTCVQQPPKTQQEIDFNPAGVFWDVWDWSKE